MRADLKVLYEALTTELEWLRGKWQEYREIFAKGSERSDVINAIAPNFFYLLQQLQFQDAMLHLCRFTDPAQSRVKGGIAQNLTIRRLAELVDEPTLKAAIVSATEIASAKCEFARLWRDKWLAHTDLEINRNGWASALPSVTAANIEEAIESLKTTMGLIDGFYGHPPAALARDPWGAKALIRHLERAAEGINE